VLVAADGTEEVGVAAAGQCHILWPMHALIPSHVDADGGAM
jgi:hypothetical protein